MGSASAVPNGLLHPPQLHSSIPWFSPANRTRSWFLSAAVTPSLYAESRGCRYSPVSCSGGQERGVHLSAAGISYTLPESLHRSKVPTGSYCEDQFITKQNGVWKFMAGSVFMSDGILLFTSQATPLLLTIAIIQLNDIAFVVDSIPAVFGVTRDPFIVFTSNLFAILGLRSFYRLISEGKSDLEYLQRSIGVVLGFIGFKTILDYFGIHASTEASLGVVATCLSAGVLLSLLKKSE